FDLIAARVLGEGCGVVPVLAVVDTVKRVGPDGVVVETLDRGELALAQTPQGFPREAMVRAYESAGAAAAGHTDDAAIVSAAGGRIVSAPGHELAFKITMPEDL